MTTTAVAALLTTVLTATAGPLAAKEMISSAQQVPTFEGTIDLEFGELDGEDPYLFSRIESIVEDANGRIIVADLQSHEVRVFDPDGRFVFRFGGAGEGPGELTDPCCLAFGPDGLLWVRESVRYSAFELGPESARYERGLRIAHTGVGMVAPVTFDALGRLVDIGPIYSSPSGLRMVRLHRNTDGAVDTVMMARTADYGSRKRVLRAMICARPMSTRDRRWWRAIAGPSVSTRAPFRGSPNW